MSDNQLIRQPILVEDIRCSSDDAFDQPGDNAVTTRPHSVHDFKRKHRVSSESAIFQNFLPDQQATRGPRVVVDKSHSISLFVYVAPNLQDIEFLCGTCGI